MMNRRKKYRIFVCFLLLLGLGGLGLTGWAAIRNQIPDELLVSENGETPGIFPYPFNLMIEEVAVQEQALTTAEAAESKMVDETDTRRLNQTAVTGKVPSEDEQVGAVPAGDGKTAAILPEDEQTGAVQAGAVSMQPADQYTIEYSLFGRIPLKTVNASVVERKEVYAGGMPIGIYLQTDGVLVVGTGNIRTSEGKDCCPAENIVKSGDYIKAANGQDLSTKEDLVECISQSGGEDLVLEIDREGEEIRLRVQPILDEDGTYRAGIWVRNDTQGIGTLTYVDEEGSFGALGHGISDVDTGTLLEVTGGTLYDAEVVSVVKGKQGIPGELSGLIHYNEGYKIGIIRENCQNGIYGVISGFPMLAEQMEKYEVAYKQSVETGEASILCSVDGTCRAYQVEIQEVRLNDKDINKGMVLKVTDPRLLELTGGIVQGMGVMYNRDNTGKAVFMRASGFCPFSLTKERMSYLRRLTRKIVATIVSCLRKNVYRRFWSCKHSDGIHKTILPHQMLPENHICVPTHGTA